MLVAIAMSKQPALDISEGAPKRWPDEPDSFSCVLIFSRKPGLSQREDPRRSSPQAGGRSDAHAQKLGAKGVRIDEEGGVNAVLALDGQKLLGAKVPRAGGFVAPDWHVMDPLSFRRIEFCPFDKIVRRKAGRSNIYVMSAPC